MGNSDESPQEPLVAVKAHVRKPPESKEELEPAVVVGCADFPVQAREWLERIGLAPFPLKTSSGVETGMVRVILWESFGRLARPGLAEILVDSWNMLYRHTEVEK